MWGIENVWWCWIGMVLVAFELAIVGHRRPSAPVKNWEKGFPRTDLTENLIRDWNNQWPGLNWDKWDPKVAKRPTKRCCETCSIRTKHVVEKLTLHWGQFQWQYDEFIAMSRRSFFMKMHWESITEFRPDARALPNWRDLAFIKSNVFRTFKKPEDWPTEIAPTLIEHARWCNERCPFPCTLTSLKIEWSFSQMTAHERPAKRAYVVFGHNLFNSGNRNSFDHNSTWIANLWQIWDFKPSKFKCFGKTEEKPWNKYYLK